MFIKNRDLRGLFCEDKLEKYMKCSIFDSYNGFALGIVAASFFGFLKNQKRYSG